MSMLEVRNLTVRYGDALIVDDVSFSVEEGERLLVVGPNGAGKSTLVNAIAQSVPYRGEVLCDGTDVRGLKPVERARRIGILAQAHAVNYAFTVEEVVGLGRYARSRGPLSPYTDEDARAVAEAMGHCGLGSLAGQSVLTLSGGELQRAFLAQALAQDPRLLVLDEPTSHLDLGYQKRVFELLDGWLQMPGRAVLAVVHDLALARSFGSRVMLMDKGRIQALGPPEKALAPALLRRVYDMDVDAWMRSLLAAWEQGEQERR
ncbi:MAG: ABC transporter ATP-binding protein [Coriobacteriales bacterium]|jgi:iron complex transport system ATP-binding protein|nr:ABC transporter ATP-binding protein [Coriobacteriales bacterium]